MIARIISPPTIRQRTNDSFTASIPCSEVWPCLHRLSFFSTATWLLVIFLYVSLAWHESNFLFTRFITVVDGTTVYRFLVFTCLTLVLLSILGKYPVWAVKLVSFYLLTLYSYYVIGTVTSPIITERPLVFASLSCIILLPIISSPSRLRLLFGVSFFFGVVLILLNSVLVLHWADWISLPFNQVNRFDDEPNLDFDPLSFGVFGLSENFRYSGHPFNLPRLQGFSIEPIHWSYLVMLTLANGIMFVGLAGRARPNSLSFLITAFILIHLLFVFSVTAFLVATAWLVGVSVGFVLLTSNFSARFTQSFICFLFPVLIIGLLLPLVLASLDGVLDGVLNFADATDLFGKSGNWETKLSFTEIGSAIFVRFFPMNEFSFGTSHNLVFDIYIRFGYIFLLPFLALIYGLSRKIVAKRNIHFFAAFSLVAFTNIFVVPGYFFSASGAISILSIAGAAYHYHSQYCSVSDSNSC